MIPKDRRDESRALLDKVWYLALGSYTEQESKKLDQWRDETFQNIFAHWSHEVEEIRTNLKRGDPMTHLVHNGMDMVSLSAILLVRIMQEAGLDLGVKK